jgi:hypothetical protein
LLLEHAEISKRWSSHNSLEATAVPITTTKFNDAIASWCSQSEQIRVFLKRLTGPLNSMTAVSHDT